MGRGIAKGRVRPLPGNRRYVGSMSRLLKTRLILGMIFSVTGIILIIIGLLGIKG